MNWRLAGTVLLLQWAFATSAYAQRVTSKLIAVRSCTLADSLLGPMKKGGQVNVWHDPDSLTYLINSYPSSDGFFQGKLLRRGTVPSAYPAPDLWVVMRGKVATRLLAERPRHPLMELVIDDSVRIVLGRGEVGDYKGPPSSAMAPLQVFVPPTTALLLARARRAAVVVDSTTTQQIGNAELLGFSVMYRFAVCDSIRMR